MPTGYTACVADGSVTDLKTFAMRLARGMGALVTMRDDPPDAEIPEAFTPSAYHDEKLSEAIERRQKLMAMTGADRENAADKAYIEAWEGANDRHAKDVAIRARYDAMLEKVEAWEGAPEGIKEFAVSQLTEGRSFDTAWESSGPSLPARLTGDEWFAEELKSVTWDIEYHAKSLQEEHERCQARNEWLAQLRKSLEGTQ